MNSLVRDRALAYLLARLGLGINIALHGVVRIGHISQFAGGLRPEFAQTILPGSLVVLAGYVIVVGEATIGILILCNLWLRSTLVAGTLLMFLLLFGTCLRQDWGTAGTQLIYIAYYAVLLATAQYGESPEKNLVGYTC
jgi:thiosulfate dehydrogenase [quinone] large subunit